MAEDIVGGLFGINPAMYQQQQQQQVFNRAVALQNLDPFQQAAVGVQQAGYNLAGALGGALGGVDPQLQRISTLNAISKQIDQTNPESMLRGAKMLADAGFQREALGLAEYARKANSELALAKQRMNEGRAAGANKDIEIAEYSANIKNQLVQLQGMEQTPDVVNAIALLQNRLDALPKAKEGAQNADIVKAQRAAQIVNQLAVLKALPADQQNPEAIRALETELAVLNPTKEVAQNAKIAEAQRAGQIVNQLATLKGLPEAQQSADAIRALEAELAVLNPTKTEKENPQIAQGLRVGELTSQIDVLESLPEAQQNKPLIKRLNAELSFLVGDTKAEARTSEVKNAREYADSLGFVSGSKEWQTAYATKFAELIATTGKATPSVGADREAIAKEIYFKPFSALTQDEIKAVNAEADKRDLAAKKAAAVQIQIPLGEAMTKALGMGEKKEQAASWGTAGEAYKAAIPMIDKLNQVKNSLSSTFTGAGADAKLAFSKGLSAFGIPVNVNEIGKAEYFNAVSSQLVQAIARVFPGSQSNKELDQLLKSKPNAYQEIPTILRLIGQIQDEMIASTKAYEKLDALGVDGRSKANPAIIEGQVYTKLKRYRELEARATGGKPMQQKDIDEAKKLQQELGVQ
jgi:hypothetical protein